MQSGRTIISRYDFKRPSVKIGYFLFLVFGVLISVSMLYPLLWILLGGFKNAQEANAVPPKLLPHVWDFTNYSIVVQVMDYWKYMSNTLVIFIVFILLKIIIISLAAYALSIMRLPFYKFFYIYFLATLMVPGMTLMIPKYLTLQSLPFLHWNLLDTYWAIWIDAGADGFGLLLLKSFFDGISREMLEAGRIDGASDSRIYRSLVMPLCKPVLATLTIFAFTYIWNDFFWPLVVIPTQDKWPIATKTYYILFSGANRKAATLNIRFGILTMVTMPPLLVYLLLQKYIVKGISFNGLKG
jgi:multiple sugar transport system permease protein